MCEHLGCWFDSSFACQSLEINVSDKSTFLHVKRGKKNHTNQLARNTGNHPTSFLGAVPITNLMTCQKSMGVPLGTVMPLACRLHQSGPSGPSSVLIRLGFLVVLSIVDFNL